MPSGSTFAPIEGAVGSMQHQLGLRHAANLTGGDESGRAARLRDSEHWAGLPAHHLFAAIPLGTSG